MKAIKVIKDLFFPSGIKCIFCDGEIGKENRYCVCGNCSPDFNTQFCFLCGKAIANSSLYCDDCKEGRRYFFEQARAPFVFGGSVKSVVHRLKYGNGRFLAKYMAEYMADVYFESGWKADMVTFVPMSKKRRKSRGYNQAELIAEEIAAIIEKPCESLLKREKETANLAKLSRIERAETIKNSIAPILSGVSAAGKNVLLIDDVMTTSATANECARALKSLNSDKVFVLTFATARVKPLLY